MDKTKNMEVFSSEKKELKPEFTEDRDEAWLEGLLSSLNAVEDWNMENATKGLMMDTMRKLPAPEAHWDSTVFRSPLPTRILDCAPGMMMDMGGCLHPFNMQQLGIALEQGNGPEMETLQKSAGTQTIRKSTRDAGVQVRMEMPPKSSPTSGKQLASPK